jgi:hypothetical protein
MKAATITLRSSYENSICFSGCAEPHLPYELGSFRAALAAAESLGNVNDRRLLPLQDVEAPCLDG